MYMKSIFFSLLLLISLSSFARLGETLEQCRQRYGKELGKFPQEESYVFFKGNFAIMTIFLKKTGTCAHVTYVKPKVVKFKTKKEVSDIFFEETNAKLVYPLSDIEKTYFKKIYSNGKNWVLFKQFYVIYGIDAFCVPHNNSIVFFNSEYIKHIITKAKKQKQSQGGF